MPLGEKLQDLEGDIMIRIKVKGSFEKTERFLDRILTKHNLAVLEKYGREGVAALSSATPVDSGMTASSWDYNVIQNGQTVSLVFVNNNKTSTGIPIAILLQYGHGNGRGGYVQGRDFINPAIQPIFDKILDQLWKEVVV